MNTSRRHNIPRLFILRVCFIIFIAILLFIYAFNFKVFKKEKTEVIIFPKNHLNFKTFMETKSVADTQVSIESQKDLDARLLALGDKEVSADLNGKRDLVRKIMKSCWDAYKYVAFGENEVNVVKKEPYNNYIFGQTTGITVIDSADTLFLMGLYEEYSTAKTWIKDKLEFPEGNSINLFETTIRVFGGLLSAYFLSLDDVFLKKAEIFGKLTITSFSNVFPPAHVVYSSINSNSKSASGCNLAEIGTLFLEYSTLSKLTKDPIYANKVSKIRNTLHKIFNTTGKPLSKYCSTAGNLNGQSYSIGSSSDSFYEYLIKGYVLDKNDVNALNFFVGSIDKLNEYILKLNDEKMAYYGTYDDSFNPRMEHLACFTGGMYALASVNVGNQKLSKQYLELAESLTETCYTSCKNTASGLCPESFNPLNLNGGEYKNMAEPYILRPELMESLFYMFRVTGDTKYQEKGWNLIKKIYEHTRVDDFGHSAVGNVNRLPTYKTGVQESFFMAETLKYAYLLFSSRDFLPLDKWVFNTEAHPLRVYSHYE